MKNLSIKMWAEDDRPREKLLFKGRNALSNAELIAILIGSGNKQKSAVDLAQEMLSTFSNSIVKLSKLQVEDLTKFKGVGEAKAVSIIAALELGRRRKAQESITSASIKSSKMAYDVFRPYLLDLNHEEFYVMALNRANKVLKIEHISKGGLSGTIADGKVIFKFLLNVNASGCILAHNHPSGSLRASGEDIRLTKSLKNFGAMIGIEILDHIIVANDSYLSLMDDALM